MITVGVNITYINANADYQPGYQYAARLEVASSQETTFELPVVMSDTQAAQIADITLYGLWLARETHQFAVGIQYIALEPSDVVLLQTPTATLASRITQVEFGAPGILKIQGAADDAGIYTSLVKGGTITILPQTLAPTGPTELHLLDIPILQSIDNNPGFYLAASGYYAGWSGASILKSDDGAAWNTIKAFITPSILGVANTILNNGLTSIPDQNNTLNVRLTQGELNSITNNQLLAGGNLAVIGSEIIQFQNAILQTDGTYNLSYFLRGRFGSEWATVNHTQYEPFTLLTVDTIQRITTDENSIGQTSQYLGLSFGNNFDASLAQPFTNQSIGLKPYSPVQLRASRDANYNVTFNWIRRTRYGGEWRDQVDVPLGEASENYEVEILNTTNAVVRTLSTNTTSVIYTALQQTTDGFIPGKFIHIKVYQLSATVGRGYPAEATL